MTSFKSVCVLFSFLAVAFLLLQAPQVKTKSKGYINVQIFFTPYFPNPSHILNNQFLIIVFLLDELHLRFLFFFYLKALNILFHFFKESFIYFFISSTVKSKSCNIIIKLNLSKSVSSYCQDPLLF